MSKRKRRAKQPPSTPKLFRGNLDYKAEFARAVSELVAQPIVDRAERIRAIDNLISEYITAVGERPDAVECERLADEILREEISDPHPDKMARNEYPIMSDKQRTRRRSSEMNFGIAENIGTDGRNYNVPKRRKITKKESLAIDKYAKIRNAERRKQYRKDTTPSEVTTYKLREVSASGL